MAAERACIYLHLSPPPSLSLSVLAETEWHLPQFIIQPCCWKAVSLPALFPPGVHKKCNIWFVCCECAHISVFVFVFLALSAETGEQGGVGGNAVPGLSLHSRQQPLLQGGICRGREGSVYAEVSECMDVAMGGFALFFF